jgi:hypothetical protein
MRKFVFSSWILALVVTSFMACVKVKGGSGARAGLVQIYTKGKDTLVCFAGPVSYESVGNKDKFSIDHTYLKVKDKSNPVKCNFSIISEDPTLRPESISIDIDGNIIQGVGLYKIYAEGYGKKDYIYRYSFDVQDSLYYKWMQCQHPVIHVNDRVFEGGKRYQKDSKAIFRMILFDLY